MIKKQSLGGFKSILQQLLQMKIQIELQIKGLRCLKGLFTTLIKIVFSSKERTNVYLVYFCQSKQIRFLISSESCMGILAIDPRVSVTDKSSTKEGAELLVVQFKDGEKLLQSFCDMADKEGVDDLMITLSKDKAQQNEEPFRCLNLFCSTDKYRSQIFKPLYDPPLIVNHVWLNGCSSPEQKKVEFDVDTEHLMNLLRAVYRHKQTQAKEKQITIQFRFKESKVVANLEKLGHNSSGQISYFNCRLPKFQGTYRYRILPQNAGRVYEMFLGKSSGSKLFIDSENRLVFSYYQQGVFESQVLTRDWIIFDSFENGSEPIQQTKMEL